MSEKKKGLGIPGRLAAWLRFITILAHFLLLKVHLKDAFSNVTSHAAGSIHDMDGSLHGLVTRRAPIQYRQPNVDLHNAA